MEIAIPLLALGSMYIMANEKKNKTKENFTSNNPLIKNTGPNYPKKTIATVQDNVNYYPNANAATDRYFQQENYEEASSQQEKDHQFFSLTGNQVDKSKFNHNNMQPFFGARVTQRTSGFESNETVLDNLQGSGTQMFNKQEQVPLFKPEQNMHWAHGTPNASNFIQSRMNPSKSMNNTKPWQEIRVAPGLDNGYGAAGKGGFNSALDAREKWISKSVDELRAVNNPKVTYEGVTLGGKHFNTERGIQPHVEKNQPDTYFVNNPDRYFTTTGLEKKPTGRSEQMLGYSNRVNTTSEYFGTSNTEGLNATYVPGEHKQSTRPVLDSNYTHISNTYANDKFDSTDGDYGVKGYTKGVKPNARSLTDSRGKYFGAISTIANALTLPIQDMLRPSRKQNVIGNARQNGGVSTETPQSYVYNPSDRARTTTKETTSINPYLANVGKAEYQGYGFLANENQPTDTQRMTTSCKYTGTPGNGNVHNNQSYAAAYNAHLNVNKEYKGRINVGNSSAFNCTQNIHIDKLDSDRKNPNLYGIQNGIKTSATLENVGSFKSREPDRQDLNCQRLEPELVSALNSNPYSHPIGSFA
uniref:Uncharacterized protein n=1 Tax=viral metagenome TaxID=1070528 RepID=A0A6C0KDH1_9ZZZZ